MHRRDIVILCKSSMSCNNYILNIDFQYIHLKINSKIQFSIICRPPNCNAISQEQIYKLFDIT